MYCTLRLEKAPIQRSHLVRSLSLVKLNKFRSLKIAVSKVKPLLMNSCNTSFLKPEHSVLNMRQLSVVALIAEKDKLFEENVHLKEACSHFEDDKKRQMLTVAQLKHELHRQTKVNDKLKDHQDSLNSQLFKNLKNKNEKLKKMLLEKNREIDSLRVSIVDRTEIEKYYNEVTDLRERQRELELLVSQRNEEIKQLKGEFMENKEESPLTSDHLNNSFFSTIKELLYDKLMTANDLIVELNSASPGKVYYNKLRSLLDNHLRDDGVEQFFKDFGEKDYSISSPLFLEKLSRADLQTPFSSISIELKAKLQYNKIENIDQFLSMICSSTSYNGDSLRQLFSETLIITSFRERNQFIDFLLFSQDEIPRLTLISTINHLLQDYKLLSPEEERSLFQSISSVLHYSHSYLIQKLNDSPQPVSLWKILETFTASGIARTNEEALWVMARFYSYNQSSVDIQYAAVINEIARVPNTESPQHSERNLITTRESVVSLNTTQDLQFP